MIGPPWMMTAGSPSLFRARFRSSRVTRVMPPAAPPPGWLLGAEEALLDDEEDDEEEEEEDALGAASEDGILSAPS